MGSVSRGVVVSTLGNLAPPLMALVTQPLLAQGLGVDGRGEVAAATAPLMLASAILTFGLPESLTYHVARGLGAASRLTKLSVASLVGFGLLGSGIIALSAGLLSGGSRPLEQLIMLGGLAIVPMLVVSALRGLAAGLQQWSLIAVERLISGCVRLASVFLLFVSGQLTPLTATVAVAVSTFFGGIIYLIGARGRYKLASPPPPPPVGAPRLYKYGISIWAGSASGVVLSRFDQLLMTPLSGVDQLGYYAVAVSVSEVILVFNSAVRDVMFSVESKAADGYRVALASRLSTLVTLSAAGFIAAVCPWAIPVFFGADFADAIPVTLLMLVAVVLGNPGSVAGAALSGRGRPGLRSLSLGIAAVLNIAAVFILVPALGAIGAALATLIGNLVAGSLNIVWLRLFFGLPIANFLLIRPTDVLALLRLLRNLLLR